MINVCSEGAVERDGKRWGLAVQESWRLHPYLALTIMDTPQKAQPLVLAPGVKVSLHMHGSRISA